MKIEVSEKLSDISKTALLTLIIRAVESKQRNPIINDPKAVILLEKLMAEVSENDKNWILKWKKRYSSIMYSYDRRNGAKRQKKFDNNVNQYISDNPGCKVIELACGFDTRFWRIKNQKCTYIEIDLPEVIKLKKQLLKDIMDLQTANHQLIGCNVLEPSWMDRVASHGNKKILFIAEGLFMYLPEQEVRLILKRMAEMFQQSQITFDITRPFFSRGCGKWLINWSFKTFMDADVSWVFGKKPEEMESYANGLKLMDAEKVEATWGWMITMSINAH